MPNEQLRFWLEAAASIVGIIGVFAIAYELQRARRADAREFLFHTYEKFSELHEERRLVEAKGIENLEDFIVILQDKDFDRAFTAISNFWDLLTRTVREQSIDSNIALDHFGRVFMTFYNKYSPLNHEFGEITGDTKYWKSFDWFAKEFHRLAPDDLEAVEKGNEYVAKILAKVAQ